MNLQMDTTMKALLFFLIQCGSQATRMTIVVLMQLPLIRPLKATLSCRYNYSQVSISSNLSKTRMIFLNRFLGYFTSLILEVSIIRTITDNSSLLVELWGVDRTILGKIYYMSRPVKKYFIPFSVSAPPSNRNIKIHPTL